LPAPDIEVELLVAMVDDHNRKMHWGHGWGVHVTLARPRSRGRVSLASPDTTRPPLIDPRYFSHPEDMPTLVAGTRKVLDIANAPALAPFRGQPLYDVDPTSEQDIEREIRRSADTEYHPCGTCRMGPPGDPDAVVDAALRVRGLRGLRVVDASVMPAITSANTNAPTIMIAERAADLVRHDR
ncbi:MAG: GMC oxidoreductase, partial [Pseudomonadota bacterium]|nr:GMC oxidoreductase [Pseudomonadota bacterium]